MQKSKFKFKIKKFIKKVNNLFIKIILFFFYFLVIGFGAMINKIFRQKQNKKDSYWQDYPQKKLDIGYFKSAY